MNEYIYNTVEQVAQALAINTMIETGMVEAAAAIAHTDEADIPELLAESLAGVTVDDGGYGSNRYTYTTFGKDVRIYSVMGQLNVEVLTKGSSDAGSSLNYDRWDKVATASLKYFELGAVVELVEAVIRSVA